MKGTNFKHYFLVCYFWDAQSIQKAKKKKKKKRKNGTLLFYIDYDVKRFNH